MPFVFFYIRSSISSIRTPGQRFSESFRSEGRHQWDGLMLYWTCSLNMRHMNLIFGWLILNRLSLLIENGSRRHSDIVAFNQFQSIVAFNVKPVIRFAVQAKRMVWIWNTTSAAKYVDLQQIYFPLFCYVFHKCSNYFSK